MNWKQHLALGLIIQVSFIFLSYFFFGWFSTFNFNFVFKILIILCYSPLVMDLDHRHGKLREGLTFMGLVTGLLGLLGYYMGANTVNVMMLGIVLASVSHLLFYTTHHRGFTHSLIFCIIYGCIIYITLHNYELAVLGVLGCYTHLIGDKIPLKVI